MDYKNLKFETLQLHAGQQPDPTTGSRAVPIYLTSAYVFNNTDHAQNLFGLKEAGNIYTRIGNPTTDVLEQRMAALEGGVAALAVASGAAAVLYSIQNIAGVGDNIVSSSTIYGGTYNLFRHNLPRYGITTKFVDCDYVEEFDKAIDEKTKAIFVESLGNPNGNIADIESLAKIAHKHKIPLIVDNTFGTPYLIRPFEFGADIVVHSATKFIGGHGTVIGGVIIDSGKFNWEESGRFPFLTESDESYHGLSYTKDIGAAAYIFRARVQLLRDMGACISPFNAFMLLQGLETLSLRVERHIENTKKIVEYLSNNSFVENVNYASLKSSKYYDLSQKYFPAGAGSIFTIDIKGGKQEAKTLIDNLKIFSLLANVADSKSLVIHSATTTHSQLNDEELLSAGIKPSTIRISVGTEHADDLIADLEQAFNVLK